MKSNYLTMLSITILLWSGYAAAQVIDPPCEIPGVILCDNIDAYVSGDEIGPQSSWWTTWSGTEGGGEDGQVSTDYAFSGTNSMKISEGGSNDVLLLLGNQTTGNFILDWWMYIPEGKTGYYNIQQSETAGLGWNLELLFGLSAVGVPSSSGEGVISIPFGAGEFIYPVDEWFKVEHKIDLDANTFEVYIDGVFAGSGAFTGNIGSIDFYSVDANCRYYVDDVLFTDIINVTYQVDITNYLAEGAVISENGMRVGGNFADLGTSLPNWSPSDPACAMTDIGGNIWEITVAYPAGNAGSTQQFKYVNGDWFPTGENEYDDGATSLFGVLGCGGDNREVSIPETDMTYLFCWETCSACEVAPEMVAVTYQVDITNYLAGGAVLSPSGIRIGGNFSDLGASLPNWTPSDPACAMTNIYDNVWSITVEYPITYAGLTQQFKFVNGDWAPTGENEYDDTPSMFGELGCGGENREQIIPEVPTTYLWCWEQCTACVVECVAVAPTGIYVDDITATTGTVHWDVVTGADQYVGALWNLTTGVIRKFRVSDVTSYTLPTALTPSTTYGVRLKTACLSSEEFSAYSPFYYFITSPLRTGEFTQRAEIYPNPSNGEFNIQFIGYSDADLQIEIFSLTGQKVFAQNIQIADEVHTVEISLLQIPAGTYFVRAMHNGSVESFPVIIE